MSDERVATLRVLSNKRRSDGSYDIKYECSICMHKLNLKLVSINTLSSDIILCKSCLTDCIGLIDKSYNIDSRVIAKKTDKIDKYLVEEKSC